MLVELVSCNVFEVAGSSEYRADSLWLFELSQVSEVWWSPLLGITINHSPYDRGRSGDQH